MGFLDHFNDISDMVVHEKCVEQMTTTIYGSAEEISRYMSESEKIVQFWSLEEGEDDLPVSLRDVLYLKTFNDDVTDVYENSRYVGYAVENGYRNVIVESPELTYVISIALYEDDELDLENYYMVEAKKSKAERKAEKKEKLDKRRAEREKTGKAPAIKKPKKAPQKGIRVDVLLSNTGRLSPDRVERAMKQVRKQPPQISGVQEIQGMKYFRAEYNFKSDGSKNRQLGYADISQNKQYCSEMFCSCADFFYRLYAPYVAAGLSTWNLPSKYKSRQTTNVPTTPHNHEWTKKTNPMGKLFLCKHLWAFMAYYVAGDAGNVELSDEELDDIINQYFADTDGDGDKEPVDTEFKKAFGKLYVGQKGKDIEHIEDPEDAKKQKGQRQTYYQLPSEKQKQGKKLSQTQKKKKEEEPKDEEN